MFVKLIQSKTWVINPEHIVSAELVESNLYAANHSADNLGNTVTEVKTEAILLDLINGQQILVASVEGIFLSRRSNTIPSLYDPHLFNGLKSLLFV